MRSAGVPTLGSFLVDKYGVSYRDGVNKRTMPTCNSLESEKAFERLTKLSKASLGILQSQRLTGGEITHRHIRYGPYARG
jgi:hypothetical protein